MVLAVPLPNEGSSGRRSVLGASRDRHGMAEGEAKRPAYRWFTNPDRRGQPRRENQNRTGRRGSVTATYPPFVAEVQHGDA